VGKQPGASTIVHSITYYLSSPTVLKTSSASCKMAIFVHLNFWKTLIRVGLCTVALGWVRNNVGKRLRFDNAGEDSEMVY